MTQVFRGRLAEKARLRTMTDDSITVQILIEIRDEIRSTKDGLTREIRSTNERLDQTNERLDQTRTELAAELVQLRNDVGQQIRESEFRMATRVVEQTAATRDLYALLTGQGDLRDRVERCERDIDDLKNRVRPTPLP